MPNNTLAQNLQRLVTAKNAIATAITNKGGTVSSGDGLEEFPSDIATIPEGGSIDYTVDVNAGCSTNVKTKKISITYDISQITSKTWYGLSSFDGSEIWSDGDYIYYSKGSEQYVLDKNTSTWNSKTWYGLSSFNGSDVWSDGDYIYISMALREQYVLDKNTSTWNSKTWSEGSSSVPLEGFNVWSNGIRIYYSNYSEQYILNKNTSVWSRTTWYGGKTLYAGNHIWTNGKGLYYSYGSNQYYISSNNVRDMTWTGLTNFDGAYIWTDGCDIFYSYNNTTYQYVLNQSNNIWSKKTWDGFTPGYGNCVWTDGECIYYSKGSDQYRIPKATIS